MLLQASTVYMQTQMPTIIEIAACFVSQANHFGGPARIFRVPLDSVGGTWRLYLEVRLTISGTDQAVGNAKTYLPCAEYHCVAIDAQLTDHRFR